MFMPSVFQPHTMRDFWDDSFFDFDCQSVSEPMKTDIKETDTGYEMIVNLPGIKKENVKVELKYGYLTITASADFEKDKKGKYIRRERYSGTSCRQFYVGKDVTESDIHAKFENGLLKLDFPKKNSVSAESKYIAIE